jgi:threonine dehydrogenase-like Zn-dependent dehydrogenase
VVALFRKPNSPRQWWLQVQEKLGREEDAMQTVYADVDIPRVLATKVLGKLSSAAFTGLVSPVHFVTQPDPPLPSPRHVRVRNHEALICGTDLHLVRVEADPRISVAALPSVRRIYLGHEVCGEVVEVGSEVSRFQVGDRVALRYYLNTCATQGIDPPCRQCIQGDYLQCEHQAATSGSPGIGGGWSDQFVAHEAQLYHPPDSLTDDEVALLEPAACGVHIAVRALPRPGDRVLVYGCSSIGLMTIQALRALAPEAHLTALARYQFQAEVARRLGAQEVRTGKDGYAVAAEMTGARVYRG